MLTVCPSSSGLDGCPLPAYRLNPWKDWGELAYKLQDEHFRIECVYSARSFLCAGRTPLSSLRPGWKTHPYSACHPFSDLR